MVENAEIEVIPGVRFGFTKSGITGDSLNAWMSTSMFADMGSFAELVPVKHYGEYLQVLDRRYAEGGKPGLFKAIMERSNPKGVAAFDQLVDQFNADLQRIVEEKDNATVQAFFRRAGDLIRPKEDQNP